jgi:Uma2 family endonuclease
MSTAEALTPMPRVVSDEYDFRENYEIIDGVRVEIPPMSADSQVVASRLAWHLTSHGISENIGEAFTEVLFKLPLKKDRNRKPDVSFVPYSRWAKNRPIPSTNAWDVLPDLCVEVVSPHDWADEIMDKVREYFEAGVRLVWVVYPRHQLVIVHESLTSVRGLNRSDTLDGGVVLPQFRLPLAELFPEMPNPPADAS